MNNKQPPFRASVWVGPVGVVLLTVLLCQSTAQGQGQSADEVDILHDQTGTAWGRSPYIKHSDRPTGPLPVLGALLPHAGDYLATATNYYEIVYMPLQTRIYLYDRKFRPISAQDVHAQMSLQLPSEATARQIPFQFVPLPAGATEQDYVAASVNLRPLQGKEISITFELAGRSNTAATFTPHYAPFNIRPYIAKASLTAADQDVIARQQICPVTGVPLGSRGPVVKLYVAEFPLYVSGEDCIAAVKAAPQKFVPQAPPTPNPGP
jgi:hypothetical protein